MRKSKKGFTYIIAQKHILLTNAASNSGLAASCSGYYLDWKTEWLEIGWELFPKCTSPKTTCSVFPNYTVVCCVFRGVGAQTADTHTHELDILVRGCRIHRRWIQTPCIRKIDYSHRFYYPILIPTVPSQAKMDLLWSGAYKCGRPARPPRRHLADGGQPHFLLSELF